MIIRYQYSCYPHYLHKWCGWWHNQLPIVKWKIKLKHMLTEKEVSKKVIEELKNGMESIGDINKPTVVNVDMVEQTITLEFKWREVKEDNYIGLINY